MSDAWDPAHYLTYAGERGRPFVDLLAQVGAEGPRTVVDLGCGAGNLTTLLARRWPDAIVQGIDASPEMIAAAPTDAGVDFEVADLRDWTPAEPVDVLVSNAVLQWVPGHLELLPRLVEAVAPGGWLAVQVPGNGAAPSHTRCVELAAEPAYAAHTGDAPVPQVHDPATYLHALRDLHCEVDAWETTYLHVLHGADAVLDWVSSTGARPTISALPEDLRPGFVRELGRRLREDYPERGGPGGAVVLPFRRLFLVARRAGGRG